MLLARSPDRAGTRARTSRHGTRPRRAARSTSAACAGGDLVGGLGIALVEERARDQPALDPPGVAIDDDLGIARRRQHQRRRVLDLVGAAKSLDARVDVERVAAAAPRARPSSSLSALGCSPDRRRSTAAASACWFLSRSTGDAQRVRGPLRRRAARPCAPCCRAGSAGCRTPCGSAPRSSRERCRRASTGG